MVDKAEDNRSEIAARRAAFRQLHESGCFVIPNPWDRGTALYLASLGFKALASTSAGFAFSRGLADGMRISRAGALAHIAEIVEATPLPVNADFEAGYADTLDELAKSVRLCAATGVAGLSIEDATGRESEPLFPFEVAVERVKAAKAALAEAAPDVVFTARAECFLTGHPDPLREAVRRLEAYAEAGADVLYAPGLRAREEIETVVRAVHPKPVNVLMGSATGLTVADLAELGVRRISLGSALARVAWGEFMRTAREIAEEGRFDRLSGAAPFAKLNGFFRQAQVVAKADDT